MSNDYQDDYQERRTKELVKKIAKIGIGGLIAFLFVIFLIFVVIPGIVMLGGDEFVMLSNKYGKQMESDQIVSRPGQRGPQIDEESMIKEKTTWFNPITKYRSKKQKASNVPAEHIGIAINRDGKAIPADQVLALTPDEKGILKDGFGVGKHFLNNYQYMEWPEDITRQFPGSRLTENGLLLINKQVFVPADSRGVVVQKYGENPPTTNTYVSEDGYRGIQPTLAGEGWHPELSNPIADHVEIFSLRRQKFPFTVIFPSPNTFDIEIRGTIYWSLDEKQLPLTYAKNVDEDDETGGMKNIQNKVILIAARSLIRTIGSNKEEHVFLLGKTKEELATDTLGDLKAECKLEGALIHSLMIEYAVIPNRIGEFYSTRESATVRVTQHHQKINEWVGPEVGAIIIAGEQPRIGNNGELVDLEGVTILNENGETVYAGGRLARERANLEADRQTKLGGKRTEIMKLVNAANKDKENAIIQANEAKDVATIRFTKAKSEAASIIAKGIGPVNVQLMKNKAEAKAREEAIQPFKSGEAYAQSILMGKWGLGTVGIFAGTDDMFADITKAFLFPAEDPSKK